MAAETSTPPAPASKTEGERIAENKARAAASVSESTDKKSGGMLSKIKQKMGREVSTKDVLRSISEGVDKGRWGSNDWKSAVTRRHLIHRTLRPDAQAWYGRNRDAINGDYQKLVKAETNPGELTPRKKFELLATAITNHRENTGTALTAEINGLIGKKDGPYQKAVQQGIDSLTAQKGRALTVRERVRVERDALLSTIKEERHKKELRKETKTAENEARKSAQAEADAETSRQEQSQREAMLGDTKFNTDKEQFLKNLGLEPKDITEEHTKSAHDQAEKAYLARKQKEAEDSDRDALAHPSYTKALLDLTGRGIPFREAQGQALEIARREVDAGSAGTETDGVDEEGTSAEKDAEEQAKAADRERMMKKGEFEEKLIQKAREFLDTGRTPTEEDMTKMRNDIADEMLQKEIDTRKTAENSDDFKEAFADLLAKNPGADIPTLKEKALDQALVKIQEKTSAQASSEAADAEAEIQNYEDILKGFGIDTSDGSGKKLLEDLSSNPDAARILLEKINAAKLIGDQVAEAGASDQAFAKAFFEDLRRQYVAKKGIAAESGSGYVTASKVLEMLALMVQSLGKAVIKN